MRSVEAISESVVGERLGKRSKLRIEFVDHGMKSIKACPDVEEAPCSQAPAKEVMKRIMNLNYGI